MTTRIAPLAAPQPLAALRALAPLGLNAFIALHRQRRALSELDARLLRDIGVPPEDARREAARPAWDVPRTWRR